MIAGTDERGIFNFSIPDKANSSSVMVVDTPNQIIGVERVDETTLDCMTRTREFNGIPAKFG